MARRAPSFEAVGFHEKIRDPAVRLCHGADGEVWFDLGDPSWRLVRVDENGWRIVESGDVPLVRPEGMRAMPAPISGDVKVLDRLRKLLNIEAGPISFSSSRSAVLYPKGPYPLLAIDGEEGSGKSTTCRITRRLLDPNAAEHQAPPRDERDLILSASNSRIVVFDNVSHITPGMADALCRLATGGGFRTRKLYSDNEETIVSVARPVLLNGIPSLLTRGDLASRAIALTLSAIPDDARQSETAILAEADAIAPALLGLLLAGLSTALRSLPSLHLSSLPRMADFARLACAAAPAFGWTGAQVLEAIASNREAAVTSIIEGDAVATAVLNLIDQQAVWSGTATDLLRRLDGIVGQEAQGAKGWPKDGMRLRDRLTRAAPALRRVGVSIEFRREGRTRTRTITITSTSQDAGFSASAASSASASKQNREVNADATADAGAGPTSATEASADAEEWNADAAGVRGKA